MKIKTISGGTRGQKDTGTSFEYDISKAAFLDIVGRVFDREAEDYKPENAKAGGLVSQFLHAYGVSADRLEKSGLMPFPEKGEWTAENTESWFNALDFETPRAAKVKVPLEERQAKWDSLSSKMSQFMDGAEIESAIGKRPLK